MSGLEQRAPERPASSDVPQLVDDYRRQQDALRKQADDLSRLLERVLATADRESKEILGSAQAEIRRVLVTARHDLLELSAQIELVRKAQQRAGDARFDEALDRASTAISERRHALHELLREARAGLAAAEPPAAEAAPAESSTPPLRPMRPLFAPAAPPPRSTIAAVPPPPLEAVPPPPVFAPPPRPQPPPPVFVAPSLTIEPPPAPEPKPRFAHLVRKARAAFFGVGVLAIAGASWWLWSGDRTGSGRIRLQPDQASGRGSVRVQSDEKSQATPVLQREQKPAEPLSITISSKRRVWVRATVDGKMDDGRFMEAGTTRNVTGKSEISLRAGDAGAVLVSVNDGVYAPLGNDGEALTRRFAAPIRPAASAIRTEAGPAAATHESHEAPVAAPPAAKVPAAAVAQPSPGAAVTEPPDLAARVAQWLDAYARHDTTAIAALSIHDSTVSDNRRSDERGAAGARASIDGVRVQLAGEQAVLSGKLIETDPSGRGRPRASWISQMWTRQNGVWLLMDARIRAESRPQ